MPTIQVHGEAIEYQIRKSNRAKYVRLRIDAENGLQIIVPARMREPPDVEALLQSRMDWIRKHRARFQTIKSQTPQHQFASGENFLYLGEYHILRVRSNSPQKELRVWHDNANIYINILNNISKQQASELIRETLLRWLRQQAKQYIPDRVAQLAGEHGFQYGRVTIRNQKTRWGSCSSNKNLNFNLRLMMMPPSAIDYVIIHELCHLYEMNHSPAFWSLVARYCPDYQHWKQWIREHEAELKF